MNAPTKGMISAKPASTAKPKGLSTPVASKTTNVYRAMAKDVIICPRMYPPTTRPSEASSNSTSGSRPGGTNR